MPKVPWLAIAFAQAQKDHVELIIARLAGPANGGHGGKSRGCQPRKKKGMIRKTSKLARLRGCEVMSRKNIVPESFGPLQGVRVFSTGTLIAEPFAAGLMAEMGAEVIQTERPGDGDAGWRTLGIRLPTTDGGPPAATNWIQERRNVFCVTLDLSKPGAREIFFKLAKRAEIWMESSKPGTYAKWGLDDETVLKANPSLVITHVSGYGQTGDPDYVGRTSYDMIGQAFGGMMFQTGFPEPTPPTRAAPWTCDYISALFALWASLAGLTYARATGRGQVIDIAQFEAAHRLLGGTMLEYFERGVVRERSGNRAQAFQPYDTFRARDGWVVIGALSGPYERACEAIGLDPNDPKWQSARTNLESVEGVEFDAILRGWVNERTAAEVVRIMNDHKVPCSPIMSSREMAEDPHYIARDVHVEWDDEQVGHVKGIGVIPKFSRTPGKVFRGTVAIGHDNERVYRGLLGLSPAEMEELRRAGVI
jgi:crotonobetainyl-CoA:carnitine CoA-transferase CaiB-like acyl-CoA transferase